MRTRSEQRALESVEKARAKLWSIFERGITNSNCDTVRAIVEKFPTLVDESFWIDFLSDDEDEYALIFAVVSAEGIDSKAHLDLVKTVYEANPDAIQQVSDYWGPPLYVACLRAVPDSVVLFLIEKHPEAASCQNDDFDGRVALHHYLIENDSPSAAVVEALMNAAPKSSQSIDHDDFAPFAIALNKSMDLSILRLLLPNHPSETSLNFRHLLSGAERDIEPDIATLLATNISQWTTTLTLWYDRWLQRDFCWTRDSLMAFLFAFSGNKTVTSLHICFETDDSPKNAELFQALAYCLEHHQALTSFTVGVDDIDTKVHDLMLNAVTTGFRRSRFRLSELKLEWFSPTTFSDLGLLLKEKEKLKSLTLSRCVFNTENITGLVGGTCYSTGIVEFKLFQCGWSSVRVMADLMTAVSESATIRTFAIRSHRSDEIPGLTQLKNLQTLRLFTYGADVSPPFKFEDPIIELLNTSPNLQTLDISVRDIPIGSICQALKQNKVLKRLTMRGCQDGAVAAESLLALVREDNHVLEKVVLYDGGDEEPVFNKDLSFYTRLNACGRGKVVSSDTTTKSQFVQLLEDLHNRTDGTMELAEAASVRYWLLREAPHLWSKLKNDSDMDWDHIGEEDAMDFY